VGYLEGMVQKMNNLYLVVSEELWSAGEDWDDPPEHYRLAELVVARSHGHARMLVWKTDGGPGDIRDMPKFAVRLKKKGVEGLARIVSDEYDLDYGKALRQGDQKYLIEYDELWDIGKAPYIGIGGEE